MWHSFKRLFINKGSLILNVLHKCTPGEGGGGGGGAGLRRGAGWRAKGIWVAPARPWSRNRASPLLQTIPLTPKKTAISNI